MVAGRLFASASSYPCQHAQPTHTHNRSERNQEMSRRLNCCSRHTYPLTSRYVCSIVAVHWNSPPKRCTCLDVMSDNDKEHQHPLYKHIPKIPNRNLIRFCSNNLHLETSTTSLQQDPLRPPVPSSKDPLDPTCCATWHLFQPWPSNPPEQFQFPSSLLMTHDSQESCPSKLDIIFQLNTPTNKRLLCSKSTGLGSPSTAFGLAWQATKTDSIQRFTKNTSKYQLWWSLNMYQESTAFKSYNRGSLARAERGVKGFTTENLLGSIWQVRGACPVWLVRLVRKRLYA